MRQPIRTPIVGKVSAFALVITLVWSSSAGAILQGLDLRTQLQYRTFDVKSRDGASSSTGGMSSNYSLGLRGPLTPWAKLVGNLTVNSLANTDEFGKQQNTNTVFNLRSYERTYTLTMGYVQNRYRSIRQLAEGPLTVSNGEESSYDLNFFMEEPSYPTINLQFRRRSNLLDTGTNTSRHRTNSWLAGAFYEVRPFRFSVDQSKQTVAFSTGASGSTVAHRRMAIAFDEKILDGLTFSGELSKDNSELTQPGRAVNDLSGSVKSFRLTATPTPAIVINAEKYTRDSTQRFSGDAVTGRNAGSSLRFRSEVLPGLGLNLTKAHNARDDAGRQVSSDNVNASAHAFLAPDVILNVSWYLIKQLTLPDVVAAKSTTTVATVQAPMGMGLDLTVDAGTTKSSTTQGPSFDSKFAGAAVRGALSADASAGLAYRWNDYSTGGLGSSGQKTQSLDANLSWVVTRSIGLNAHVNYYLNSGDNISEYISPYIDLRWTPNTMSALTLRYNFSKSRQWDWTLGRFINQGDQGLSGRLTQELGGGSSLDVLYDFQSSSLGSIASQRSLQVYFNHRL
ncbi:MAG: hypothetical protein Q7T82_16180 [Armatimonadota bacterium]|nr:hypothetical protein [Armatimonadota bacterium]